MPARHPVASRPSLSCLRPWPPPTGGYGNMSSRTNPPSFTSTGGYGSPSLHCLWYISPPTYITSVGPQPDGRRMHRPYNRTSSCHRHTGKLHVPSGPKAVPNAEAVLRVRPQRAGRAFPLNFQERARSQTSNTHPNLSLTRRWPWFTVTRLRQVTASATICSRDTLKEEP